MHATSGSHDRLSVVRERYARAVLGTGGCCEPACCADAELATTDDVSLQVGYTAKELATLPDEADLGLGCGNPTAIAGLTEGLTVLDLGSGAGIDCFLAARQVGPTGRVIGVDMTAEMIAKARENAQRGGYGNVEFRLGEIEALPMANESVDVVISNCVLNLSPAKERALAEAYRVLKPGGRAVVSDMVSDVPVPTFLTEDLDAIAACLPTLRGTYLEQFRIAGFQDVRITAENPYPATYILGDEGVRAFLADHPGTEGEIEAFARSIVGAHFEAGKG